MKSNLTRRAFVARSTAAVGGGLVATTVCQLSAGAAVSAGPHQAMGTRAGEVTDTTAIVWTRLTAAPTRNNSGVVVPPRVKGKKKEGKQESKLTVPVEQLEGACPGAPGRVQLRYGTREDLSDATTTECGVASAENDFICEFKLAGLKPATVYHYVSEIPSPAGTPKETAFHGKFETAPAPGAPGNLRFCVMTCQGYADRGHADGHHIYPAMLALKPQFTCLTGDLVYYDSNEPRAVTERLARYHWERMFSLPRLVEFNRNIGCYWLKDDHDTLSDDSWPGMKAGELTFAEGQKIFRQQAPMNDDGPSYRTIRWGRDLQVWLSEGRDFRSPNKMADGPDKTIWGAEQKAWFKRTVKESNATWKVLVSPTPFVGPDRTNKNDNHSNAGFQHEGDELRGWIKENVPEHFFVITGDRHWQYHSVHPDTGLNEFSVGAASDEHAGGTPGFNPAMHKFHLVKGGFLSVTLKREGRQSRILFEHRDVLGKVVYEFSASRIAS
ncbi:MAG: alkaline phosphatase D family protein [Verrucomicrobia bacterium]|nr:alkaline phosphatase D family protein [Verrucomicrobiota bacterium]